MSVILINPFSVAPENAEHCLAFWDKAAEYMRRQPGFLSTRLHRALSPQAEHRYVNVAEWASAEDFQRAVSKPEFLALVADPEGRCPHAPELYAVVRE